MGLMTPEEKIEFHNRLTKIDANMTRVLYILDNDRNTNQSGIVETVKRLEKEVEVLKVKERIFHTKVVTYSGIAATLVAIVIWIGDKLIQIAMKQL